MWSVRECADCKDASSRSGKFGRRESADKPTGVRFDQTIVLTGPETRKRYPQPLRGVGYYSAESDRRFDFLKNHFAVPATTTAELYRHRWQAELFFRWIKQHLRIMSFFGTIENAVKTRLSNAVAVYVLVAVVTKRLDICTDLYTVLQILSLTLFEKVRLIQLLTRTEYIPDSQSPNQLILFE